jgi:putative transposase
MSPTMTSICYKRHRFSPEVIAHALWLYHRFPLSLRHVEEMLLARGVQVSYETIRRWSAKFGPEFARTVRRRATRRGDVWHLDELQVKIGGKPYWLWRAVDAEGYVLDEVVSVSRDKKQARRLLVRCLKAQGWRKPRRIVTDKLRSYSAALRELMPSVRHLCQRLRLSLYLAEEGDSLSIACLPISSDRPVGLKIECKRTEGLLTEYPFVLTRLRMEIAA